ncbi:hypothetical protein DVH24_014399 [Malus domestica]|uniref:Uncharacterized protein n=1 Tax=Malus domestica TaxID=3750 RepID=A0A498IUD0_MALDO|nr:hypothetical protein DVH24_014399 [Malus domestica]
MLAIKVPFGTQTGWDETERNGCSTDNMWNQSFQGGGGTKNQPNFVPWDGTTRSTVFRRTKCEASSHCVPSRPTYQTVPNRFVRLGIELECRHDSNPLCGVNTTLISTTAVDGHL